MSVRSRSDLVRFLSRMEKKIMWKKLQEKEELEKNYNNVWCLAYIGNIRYLDHLATIVNKK